MASSQFLPNLGFVIAIWLVTSEQSIKPILGTVFKEFMFSH
jgi:hypothetical protein